MESTSSSEPIRTTVNIIIFDENFLMNSFFTVVTGCLPPLPKIKKKVKRPEFTGFIFKFQQLGIACSVCTLIGFGATLKVGGGIMRVERGQARIAAEKGECVGGGIPLRRWGKIKTLKYAFSATLYQVFLTKIKIPSLPVVFFSTDVTPN